MPMKFKNYINTVFSMSFLVVIIVCISICCGKQPIQTSSLSPPAVSGSTINTGISSPVIWKTMLNKTIDYEQARVLLKDLMKEYGITALSIAIGNRFREKTFINLGHIDIAGQIAVTDRTIFQAGRISQPIFGWLFMTLVDEGLFDLDKPIVQYLKRPVFEYPGYEGLKGDPRCQRLTGRLVLSHQSGLTTFNSENHGEPISFLWSPGKQFGYSDAAYRLLQLAVEESTGRNINDLAKEKVFSRLSMNNTSFIRESRFDGNIAGGQKYYSGYNNEQNLSKADVSNSLFTTSHDLLTFIWMITYPTTEMSLENWGAYFEKQTNIDTESIFSSIKKQNGLRGLGWSLGWGKFIPQEGYLTFQGDRHTGYENYAGIYAMMAYNCLKAIVILSVTAENARPFIGRILEELLGDTFSPLEWMALK